MASTVSSYLSKSKKDFKPKAPLRRPGVPGSSQSSVRGSVERQIQSHAQVPQSPVAQVAHAISTNHTEAPISENSGNEDLPIPKTTSTMKATAVPPRPSEDVPASADAATAFIIPSQAVQRTLPTNSPAQGSGNAVAISIPTTRQPTRQPRLATTPLDDQIIPTRQRTVEEASSTVRPLDAAATSTTSESGQQLMEPAAKRRKINPAKKRSAIKKSLIPGSSVIQTNPSTDTQQGRTVPTNNLEDEAISQSTRLKKKRQMTRTKGKQLTEGVTAAVVADTTREPDDATGSSRRRKKRSDDGRKRAKTPENAEEVQIDTTKVTMADLCRDRRTGKKSKREKALQARDEEELLKKQQQVLNADSTPAPETTGDSSAVSHQIPKPSETQATVPGVRIVNGQLVLDESTRTIDRVALANEARGDDEEVVVIDSLSHKVNSMTYMKRGRLPKWNEEKTDRFYEGLRMFGTDFGMISKLFPGMSRRALKCKFNKEERLDLEKINNTLWKERIPVDMEIFSEMTKTIYKDPAELEREMAEDRKVLEEEQAKEKEAMDEAARQRVTEAAAESAGNAAQAEVIADSSAKENEVQGSGTAARGKRGTKGLRRPKGKQKEKAPAIKGKMPKVFPKTGKRATKILAPLP